MKTIVVNVILAVVTCKKTKFGLGGYLPIQSFPIFKTLERKRKDKNMANTNTLMNYLIPEDMEQYLSYYGTHFNKLLCDFAVSKMKREDKQTGVLKKITPITMEELKPILEKYKVSIDTNEQYDALYLANMVKADFWGSSIEDEEHMARYIQDVLCDPDGCDGLVFCRFLGDCSCKGVIIFWEQMVHSAW